MFLCCLYALLLIRFCFGRPNPSTDYLAKLNDPVVSVPAVDRAWPMWEKAILAALDGFKDGSPVFSDAILWGRDAPPWSQTARWIDQHQGSISLARQAGQLPSLGNVYGPGGSQDDKQRYSLVAALTPGLKNCQANCERYLGSRDGTVVAIALEIYHRRNGRYPVALSELTPEFLP